MQRSVSTRRTTRPLASGVLLALVASVVLFFDVWVVQQRESSKADDFFQFWAAGKALLQRTDPYGPQAWQTIYENEGRWRYQTDQQVFPYPLWTAYVFVPLAALPVPWAALVWAVLSQALLVLAVFLWVRGLNWTGCEAWLPFIIAMVVAFEPVSLTILFGQLGMVLLAVIAAMLYFLSRGRYSVAGMCLALTLLKPQLFTLVITVILVTTLLDREWSFAASFVATATGLFASSWLLVPGWLPGWQGYLMKAANVRLRISPTIWGLSHSLAAAVARPHSWVVIGLLALSALASVVVYLWWPRQRIPREQGRLALLVSSAVVASLLVTPYVLSYDFALLLLPILTCIWLVQPVPKLSRRALLFSLALCALVLPWGLLAISAITGRETLSALLPVSVLGLLVATDAANRRRKAATMATPYSRGLGGR
jgi:hypothetical protein